MSRTRGTRPGGSCERWRCRRKAMARGPRMSRTLARQAKTASPMVAGSLRSQLQRKCACGTHMPGGGACRSCGNRGIQRKLWIGSSNDPLESEADRVAAQVLCAAAPTGAARNRLAVQRFATPASEPAAEAPASVHRALGASGSRLSDATRKDMEGRFGHDFSRVRVHHDAAAAESAREIDARAYIVGNRVVFGAGQFAEGSQEGRYLLAHELTHVVQQGAAGAHGAGSRGETLRRFSGREHIMIGSAALPGQDVEIVGYGRVSYGEMIAMAGDYFESIDEIRQLAKQGPAGTRQIDLVRWKLNPSSPRPKVGADVEKKVEDRYNALAARNETHFSTGSAPGKSNREQYIAAHTAAITTAYKEGSPSPTPRAGWEAMEAFSNHFLTDAFSGGHVRTPRGQVRAHWNGLYPHFIDNLVGTISCYMASYVNDRDRVGYVQSVDDLAQGIAPEIRRLGGSALASFSIGDIISLAMHDADNKGLDVVSARGPAGPKSKSQFKWRAVGDGGLYPSSANAAAAQTQEMVQEAVQISFSEARQAHGAGKTPKPGLLATLTDPKNYGALDLLPQADSSSTTNPAYAWKAPTIGALPANLVTALKASFAKGSDIESSLNGLPVRPTETRSGFTLHTGDAWKCFVRIILGNPIKMINDICNGNLCPPGKDNPCP